MALLYSRPRIKIPKIYIFKRSYNKSNKIFKLCVMVIFFVIICVLAIESVMPTFNSLCSSKAKSIATTICNKQTTESLQGYEYSDFITIHTDSDQNITMLEANMININTVISDIAEKIQIQIDNTGGEDIYISSGSFTGISLLSGRGPKVPIRISTVGNVKTNVKSEFTEKGVNQTLHRLYLEIECEVNILTPFNIIDEKIENQFIIVENVIVGNIPSSYYNLEGINESEAIQVIE